MLLFVAQRAVAPIIQLFDIKPLDDIEREAAGTVFAPGFEQRKGRGVSPWRRENERRFQIVARFGALPTQAWPDAAQRTT